MTEGLVRYEAARQALYLAASVDEVKEIRDKCAAMAAYARQAKDTELVEWATELKVRAERRAGEMLAGMEKHNGGRPSANPSSNGIGSENTRLADLGISLNQSSRWQKLAAVTEERFEEAVAAAKEIAGEVTTAALLRLNGKNHMTQGTGQNEWYTPAESMEAARAVMGAIDLDPASSAKAQETVKAERYFSVEDDGLNQAWGGRVWLNPPYSQPAIQCFVEKLVEEYKEGRVTEAILLVNNSSDTEWFHIAARASKMMCFTRGRIRFQTPDDELGNPLQGQVFFYYGENRPRFQEVFEPFGVIVRRV